MNFIDENQDICVFKTSVFLTGNCFFYQFPSEQCV